MWQNPPPPPSLGAAGSAGQAPQVEAREAGAAIGARRCDVLAPILTLRTRRAKAGEAARRARPCRRSRWPGGAGLGGIGRDKRACGCAEPRSPRGRFVTFKFAAVERADLSRPTNTAESLKRSIGGAKQHAVRPGGCMPALSRRHGGVYTP
jgi:hypothetical protein